MHRKLINIRLDSDLWLQARSVAIKQGKTMQDWLTEAIIQKLKSDGVEVEQNPRTSP
jgi:hypothetical protein